MGPITDPTVLPPRISVQKKFAIQITLADAVMSRVAATCQPSTVERLSAVKCASLAYSHLKGRVVAKGYIQT